MRSTPLPSSRDATTEHDRTRGRDFDVTSRHVTTRVPVSIARVTTSRIQRPSHRGADDDDDEKIFSARAIFFSFKISRSIDRSVVGFGQLV